MKEENPGFGVTEVSKKAGEMWAKIDGDTKERFEKKARAAKEKYEEEYKVWFEGGGEDALKAQKKEKKAEKKARGSGSSSKKPISSMKTSPTLFQLTSSSSSFPAIPVDRTSKIATGYNNEDSDTEPFSSPDQSDDERIIVSSSHSHLSSAPPVRSQDVESGPSWSSKSAQLRGQASRTR